MTARCPMKSRKPTPVVFAMLVGLVLSGCGPGSSPAPTLIDASTATASPPAATPTITPIPATPTASPIPPTPTTTAIPVSSEPVPVGDFSLKVASVTLGTSGYNGLVPANATPGQNVLSIEAALAAGDFADLGKIPVWVTDEGGNRADVGVTLTIDSKKTVIWLFPVGGKATSFLLHFPSGAAVDVSSLVTLSDWRGILIMPGAKNGEQHEDAQSYTYFFDISASATSIKQYYQHTLPKLGWSPLPDFRTYVMAGGAYMSFDVTDYGAGTCRVMLYLAKP